MSPSYTPTHSRVGRVLVSAVALLSSAADGLASQVHEVSTKPDQVLANAIAMIHLRHRHRIPESDLWRLALVGLVEQLSDPYVTVIFGDTLNAADSIDAVALKVAGLGTRRIGSCTAVESIPLGSAVGRSGIRLGDAVHSAQIVNGRLTIVTRRRDGESTAVLDVALAEAAIDAHLNDPRASVIKVRSLVDGVADRVRRVLESIGPEGSVTLDLSANTGGSLAQAYQTAEFFLAAGDTMGYVIGRSGPKAVIAESPALVTEIATVVVDSMTASAAEILASALADNGRADVIGTRTYGKDVIQAPVRVGASTVLTIPVGRWLRKGGRRLPLVPEIQESGGEQDVPPIPKYLNACLANR